MFSGDDEWEDAMNSIFLHRREIFGKELSTVYLAGFLELSTVMTSFTLIPLYVKHAGGGDFAIGVQAAIFTLFSVLFRFLLGSLADSRGRKLSLLIGSLVFSTAPIGIWLSPSLVVMALFRVYQAIGMATFLSAATSYVADHTPDELRGTGIGMYRTAVTLSVMIAPALGMTLIQNFGFASFFIASSLCGVAGTLLILTLPEKIGEPHQASPDEEKGVSVRELFDLFRIPELRSTYLGIFALSMASGILLTFLTGYALGFPSIGNPAFYFTIRESLGALGTMALGALSDRLGRDRLLGPVLLSFAAGCAILAFMEVSPRLLYYLSAVISGVGYAGALALLIAKVVDSVPARLRASALAFQESAIDGGNAFGIFIFGSALSLFSFPVLFAAMALFIMTIPFLSVLARGERKGRTAAR